MTTQPHTPPQDGGEPHYLFNPGAQPDPQIARLEHALQGVRHRGDALAINAPTTKTGALRRWGAIAAAIAVLGAGTTWFVARAQRPSWAVTALAGDPRVDSSDVSAASRLKRGDWLETDGSARASLTVADIGRVTIEPDSRVRLVETREGRHRMELKQGTIHAFITAPERVFFVDTPSAQAIDLGCIYTLTVGADGSSELKTTFGLVELARTRGGQEIVSKVPTGALCRTDVARGPGTPRFEDAPAALVTALDAFDAGTPGVITTILDTARPQDTMTLWHLLARTQGDDRAKVLGTLASLAGPASVPDADTLKLNPQALAAWWTHLQTRW